MSRTIRRKGYSRSLDFNMSELVWNGNWHEWTPLDPKSAECKKRVAIYRSDSGSFMGKAPSWFNRWFQRRANQFYQFGRFPYAVYPVLPVCYYRSHSALHRMAGAPGT